MIDVITYITIKAPLKRVVDYACNPYNAPDWYVNIKTAELMTDKPMRIGSKIAFTAHFMGKKLSYIYEVLEFSDTNFVMRTAEGPFPMKTTYQFEKIDGHTTKMILRNCGSLTGFSKLFAPYISRVMRKTNCKDLNKIKSILENEDYPKMDT